MDEVETSVAKVSEWLPLLFAPLTAILYVEVRRVTCEPHKSNRRTFAYSPRYVGMSPDGRIARWLDYIEIELDTHPSVHRYAALRITRTLLARQIPAWYPAPVALHWPDVAERRAA